LPDYQHLGGCFEYDKQVIGMEYVTRTPPPVPDHLVGQYDHIPVVSLPVDNDVPELV
jgi:hypothetical protein